MQEKNIAITIHYADEKYTLHTYKNEYRNLMQLIHDQLLIDEFAYCQGMGRCGTCMIKALNHTYNITDYDRNELL